MCSDIFCIFALENKLYVMINKEKILEEAIKNCMREMYKKAQPSEDWDHIVYKYQSGEIGKNEIVYDRYYLSQEEFTYILNKYLHAYRLEDKWPEYVEVVEKYLRDGGLKDYYVPEVILEDGSKQPGYRTAEKVPSIQESIYEILNSKKPDEDNYILSKKIADKVLENIKLCKEFYKFGRRDEDAFRVNVSLGASPTCNPKTVIEYWKSQGKDIDIEERNPLLFWEKDEYGEEFESIMEEDYGKDWKELWDKKWKEEVKKREEEQKKKIEELEKQLKNGTGKN